MDRANRRVHRGLRALTFAALAAGAVIATPSTAHAEKVTPTAKGVVGGALLGGEVVVFAEALFGVRSTAAYIIGAAAGAVGGGVGGFFIEKAVDDGRIPAYLLAGGLAALIPAIVVSLDATRYLPTEGAREDKPSNLPPSDPGKPGGSSVIGAEPARAEPPATTPSTTPESAPAPSTPTPSTTEPPPSSTPPAGGAGGGGGGGGTQQRAMLPPSLVDLTGGAFRVGVPVPEVRPILGSAERARLGAQNTGSELRFSVVRLTF